MQASLILKSLFLFLIISSIGFGIGFYLIKQLNPNFKLSNESSQQTYSISVPGPNDEIYTQLPNEKQDGKPHFYKINNETQSFIKGEIIEVDSKAQKLLIGGDNKYKWIYCDDKTYYYKISEDGQYKYDLQRINFSDLVVGDNVQAIMLRNIEEKYYAGQVNKL